MAIKILGIVTILVGLGLVVLRALVIAKIKEKGDSLGVVVRSEFQYGDALAWRVLRVPRSLTSPSERMLFRAFFAAWILVYALAAVIICIILMD